MYGIVNKAVQELIVDQFGQDKWEAIKEDAGFSDEGFISLKSYPDEITFKLVGSASRILDTPSDVLMYALGEYWILFTAEKGFSEMLTLAGKTFPEFLRNLDMLHLRVSNLMPHLAPPTFEVKNESEHSLELHYHSHRSGFIPMLKGITMGLAKRFEIQATIEHIREPENQEGSHVFLISW
jgi:hypothetical protein